MSRYPEHLRALRALTRGGSMSGSITLYIAEKPSMARDIAKVLGARNRDGIKWVGEGVWVSWCIGHLVEIAAPDVHDAKWKSWRPEVLPVLPSSLKWIPKKKTGSHLKQLRGLIRDPRVSRVVNACDAGREGELIFRSVYAQARGAKPVWRFWVSSLTTEAIRKGLNQLRPSADFDPLGAAAYCRAEADWLVGMNATRALTARADGLLSLGRVQTPTLAMVVKRQAEIDDFQPEDYWIIEAELEARNGERWRAHWSRTIPPGEDPSLEKPSAHAGKFKRLEDAEEVLRRCRNQVGEVIRAEGKTQRVPPPQLFHLTALQQEANRRFGLTAEQTLKVAQALYEKHKALSYPRTDSRYLTPDVARSLPRILGSLQDPWEAHAQSIISAEVPKLGKRYINAQRVTDHHAIIPTDARVNLTRFDRDERRIYELVVRSLLAALSPPAVDQHMALEVLIAGELWSAQGRAEVSRGWREVASPPLRPPKERTLPYVPVGTPTRIQEAQVDQRQTQPPKPFTDATLLGAMEHAGRQIEESELRAVMRESGLGTPATRANIINTLLHRGYLSRQKKTLIPTEAGKVLIGAVNEPALLVPELTAQWERRLQSIASGDEDPQRFHQEVRSWVDELVGRLLQGSRVHVPDHDKRGRKGKRAKSKRAQPNREGAHSTSSKSTSAQRATEVPSRRWGQSSGGAQARQGESSSSSSSWRAHARSSRSTARGKSTSKKSQNQRQSSADLETITGQRCPRCREGAMIRGQRGWGCSRWRQGCAFVLWFEHDGVAIPEPEAARLCVRGKTRLFHQHEGIKYRLLLSADQALAWEAGKSRKRAGARGGAAKGRRSSR